MLKSRKSIDKYWGIIMNFRMLLAVFGLIGLAACTKPVTVTQPLPENAFGQVHVTDIAVSYTDAAKEGIQKDNDRQQKKAEDGKADDKYEGLKFTEMMENLLSDRLAEADVDGPRNVSLDVAIDTLKFVSAAMTIIGGDSDQLAGLVTVKDSGTGEQIAEFYVDVLNSHGGLLGLAIRGTGVREQLAQEFADHVIEQLQPKS
jgi:hypothetical protein